MRNSGREMSVLLACPDKADGGRRQTHMCRVLTVGELAPRASRDCSGAPVPAMTYAVPDADESISRWFLAQSSNSRRRSMGLYSMRSAVNILAVYIRSKWAFCCYSVVFSDVNPLFRNPRYISATLQYRVYKCPGSFGRYVYRRIRDIRNGVPAQLVVAVVSDVVAKPTCAFATSQTL